MDEIRQFPDIQSYIRFLRGKSNEIKPIEVEEKPKKAKKPRKKKESTENGTV